MGLQKLRTNLYTLSLVKNRSFSFPVSDCAEPVFAARAIEVLIADAPNEHMVAVFINAKMHIIGTTILAQGGQHGLNVCARDVFRAAIVAHSSGIILGHNHPSGDTTPSLEDLATTRRLVEAGKLLGLLVLDHIIVGLDAKYHSMMENESVQF